MKATIQELEELIRKAQLSNDVKSLDELISDDLRFVVFDGSIASKQDDLEAHRKKAITFKEIKFSEQCITIFDQLASVTVKAEIYGAAGGQEFHGVYRYLRNWSEIDGQWRVVSGSVVQILGGK